ncbi:MAG TPA: hypothetical protein VHB25_08765 [Gemmatimonadaceae bacterium]|nr:hypothetical protein [Gemmatimonadaceae bacterium]
MFHRWAALVLVLALCAMTPKNAAGQSTQQAPRGHSAGSLGRAAPNPFNPQTFINFAVGDTANGCINDRQQHVVTIRILNILAQQVAVPVLNGPASGWVSTSTSSEGLIDNLQLPCGVFVAWWQGYVQGTNKEAASGTYLVQLFVDRQPAGIIRIFNAK